MQLKLFKLQLFSCLACLPMLMNVFFKLIAMGNTISGVQKSVALNLVQSNETNNNNVPKNPHSFTNTAGVNPPPECPMHVKVEEKKSGGCADAGKLDDINPLNMVNITNR